MDRGTLGSASFLSDQGRNFLLFLSGSGKILFIYLHHPNYYLEFKVPDLHPNDPDPAQ